MTSDEAGRALTGGVEGKQQLRPVLEGSKVIFVGSKEDSETCQAMVEALGGEFLTKVTRINPPNVMVARDVTSDKYLAALSYGKVPVVALSWLGACKDAGKKVPFADHAIGAFAGLKVCASGFLHLDRNLLKSMVEAGGGEFFPNLTKDCTHLVYVSPYDSLSKKLQMARKWKVPVVSREWVETSAELGVRLKEDAYPALMKGAPRPAGPFVRPPPAPQASAPSGASRPPQPPSHEASAEITTAELPSQGSGGCALRGEGLKDRCDSASSPAERSREGDGGGDEESLYLDGVRVVLSCCSAKEAADQARLAREAGATRQTTLAWNTTHVVVGSEPSSWAVAELRGHLARFASHTRAVTTDWLHSCSARRARLEPTGEQLVTLAKLAGLKDQVRSQENAKQHVAAATTGQEIRKPLGSSTSARAGGKSEGRPLPPPPRQRKEPRSLLEGLHFTLTALDGHKELMGRAAAVISAGGGCTILDTMTEGLPDKLFAVCPLGFPPEAQQRAKTSSAFRHVERRRWVTVHWLEFTSEMEKLHPPSSSLLFQPVEHELPLPWMAGIKLAVSGYDDTQRNIIRTLTRALGGRFTSNMTRKNTHLVLPLATGDKYKACEAYGVTPVTCDWLLSSTAKGVRMPEEKFAPKPSPGQSCKADVPSISQMPSQICNTQRAAGAGVKVPRLLSLSQPDSTQPEFLDRLLEKHKVSRLEAEAARPATRDDPPRAAPQGPQRSMSRVRAFIDDLVGGDRAPGVEDGPGQLQCNKGDPEMEKTGGNGQVAEAREEVTLQNAPHDDVMDLLENLAQVAEQADVSQIPPATPIANHGHGSPSHESKGKRKRGRGAVGDGSMKGRLRSRRTRPMPSSDGSNQDSDLMFSQLDSGMKVVYQEGEKTAQVLERCSRRSLRSRPGRTVSAKEFLNRAVLSGIDNNTEHPDELMEMGLL